MIRRTLSFDSEVPMKRSLSLALAAVIALAFLAAPVAAQAAAQTAAKDKPVDMKKLLAEIVGDYNFDFQGQSLLVQFIEQDGKLFGAPPGETPEEIHPVEGKPLTFDVTVAASGEYYLLEFVRNDQGVIDRCVMTVQGMVLEGYKLKK
jgi:hypothetical protein